MKAGIRSSRPRAHSSSTDNLTAYRPRPGSDSTGQTPPTGARPHATEPPGRTARRVAVGYTLYTLVGALLLCLPWAQSVPVPALDNLFTAMSAVSTTGLVTVATGDSYTFFGELVVTALIQLGGVGYMTLGSAIILSRKAVLDTTRASVGNTVFSLPATFRLEQFVRSVAVFTLLIEGLGAALLYPVFAGAGVPAPSWSAVFHSVSAFCTAGFGLHSNSFESYPANGPLNAIITVLSYLGAVGFIVCLDLWNNRQSIRNMTLTSRIILWVTLGLSTLGFVMLFFTEPTINARPPAERAWAALFQTMTSLTTVGFNTIPLANLSRASVVMTILFMVVGASPSGTGGGIKVTTLTTMAGVIRAAMRGRSEIRFFGREIPVERVTMAVATFGYYLALLTLGVWGLTFTESAPLDAIVFEAASALGTVGLSLGLTGSLTTAGKLIVIALMFVGRTGPITFGTALFVRQAGEAGSEPPTIAEDLAV